MSDDEVQAGVNRLLARAAMARDYYVPIIDRCPDCGKVPGKWQPTVGGRLDELTLEECRTCGAAWTGLSWSRIGRAKS